eukprot:jgi/Chlat1/5419/Chrsp35S05230
MALPAAVLYCTPALQSVPRLRLNNNHHRQQDDRRQLPRSLPWQLHRPTVRQVWRTTPGRHVRPCMCSAASSAASPSKSDWFSFEEFSQDNNQREKAEAMPDLPPVPASGHILEVLPFLWRVVVSNRKSLSLMVLAFVLLAASKALGLAVPLLFKRAVDTLTTGKYATIQAAAAMAVKILALSGLCKALKQICSELRNVVFAPVGQEAGRQVSRHVFSHVLALDMHFHLDRRTGELAKTIDRGIRSVSMILRAVIFTLMPTVLELGLVCALLMRDFNPNFTGAVLLTFAAYVTFTIHVTGLATVRRKQVKTLDNMVTSKAVDALLNIETLAQFNNQDLEQRSYDRLLERYQKEAVKLEHISALLNAGQSLILSVGVASVMVMAAHGVGQGVMTVGDLVMANGLLLQLWEPLNFLGYFYRELRTALVYMEDMFKILATKSSIVDGTQTLERKPEGAHLLIKDVRFGYNPNREILHGVSIEAKSGESIALVGHSGSGKSTVVKLLLRLYDVNEGEILIDGEDVRNLTIASLRDAAAVVPQDTVLFNDTIYNNIEYGKPGASRADVINAARMARLHDTIMGMPDGYDTMVGERGLKLSGGEKQRVAIARAFLKKPRLLICDEATSALDTATESGIIASLRELAAGRTCLFVAHRLSTIMHCNRIIVMEGGLVMEEGSHSELMARNGLYARMWALQQSEEAAETAKQAAEDAVLNMVSQAARLSATGAIDLNGVESVRQSLINGR